MSKVKAQLEALFGADKVRKTETGFRANAEDIQLDTLWNLATMAEGSDITDMFIKRSGTGIAVVIKS